MNKVRKCIKLLEKINDSSGDREKIIYQFQEIIWNDENSIEGPIGEILIDLAHDLEYYEPNDEIRKNNYEYYDESKLLEAVNEALYKIKISDNL